MTSTASKGTVNKGYIKKKLKIEKIFEKDLEFI